MPSIILNHSGFQLTSPNPDDLETAQRVEDEIANFAPQFKCNTNNTINNNQYLVFVDAIDEKEIIGTVTLQELQNEMASYFDLYRDDQIDMIPFYNGIKINVPVQITHNF